jgi:hypothetical protein
MAKYAADAAQAMKAHLAVLTAAILTLGLLAGTPTAAAAPNCFDEPCCRANEQGVTYLACVACVSTGLFFWDAGADRCNPL